MVIYLNNLEYWLGFVNLNKENPIYQYPNTEYLNLINYPDFRLNFLKIDTYNPDEYQFLKNFITEFEQSIGSLEFQQCGGHLHFQLCKKRLQLIEEFLNNMEF